MSEISIRDLKEKLKKKDAIELCEKEYFGKVNSIAQQIIEDGNIKLVLLAGPSGSGKTTTANLIADRLRELGEEAIVVSLDDFYRSHADPEYPRSENGDFDYECPEALNIPLLASTLADITTGRGFTIPKYDFELSCAVDSVSYPPLIHGCVIIEGLHALNPKISGGLPKGSSLKVFVSVSTNINDGERRIISGRKIRFIRRIVRDSIYRGADASRTLSMWQAVIAAEDIYLYPYKQDADISFDTFHDFELGVMKPFVNKLISLSLAQANEYAATVRAAMEEVDQIDSSLVPETSLIREFIPGGVYEHLY